MIACPLISGALLWFSFPNFSLFPLAWIALIPYMHFLIQCRPWRVVVWGHFVMGGVYFGCLLYWIPRVLVVYGKLDWPLAVLVYALMIVGLCLFLLPFSVFTRWISGKSSLLALWFAPGFWVLTELLRNYYAMNGFPWGLLGYSQSPYIWLIQIADLGGVYLVSFFIVLANCLLLASFRYKRWKYLFVFGVIFLAANLYGCYRVYVWQPVEQRPIKTALIQPAIALTGDGEYYERKYFETLPAFYRKAANSGAQWVIFPEAPNPYFFQENACFVTSWRREVITFGSYLLFNSTLFTGSSPRRYFNGAILLDPEGKETYRYHKIHLVPFGEYVPLANWLDFVEPFVREVGSYSGGTTMEVGTIGDSQFATLICYESIFPELALESVSKGAQILVNITNDTWFGNTAAPRQHLQMATFRAIETRKPLLRSANSGYSAVIDRAGRIQQEMELFKEGILLTEVVGNSYRSTYSYLAQWLNMLLGD